MTATCKIVLPSVSVVVKFMKSSSSHQLFRWVFVYRLLLLSLHYCYILFSLCNDHGKIVRTSATNMRHLDIGNNLIKRLSKENQIKSDAVFKIFFLFFVFYKSLIILCICAINYCCLVVICICAINYCCLVVICICAINYCCLVVICICAINYK
jgi:hypothetical protein